MECAALWSLLVTLPYGAIPSNRFRERRDRPFCHLMIRQQTWQEFQNSDRRRWTADVGIALAISTPGAFCVRRHLQAIRLPALTAAADRLLLCTKAPRPCALSCWPGRKTTDWARRKVELNWSNPQKAWSHSGSEDRSPGRRKFGD
jgi:hypothetical protein